MKTVLVLSDTHGNIRAIEKLVPIMKECDYVFHLGDHDSDMRHFVNDIKGQLITVKGNCDGGGKEQTVDVEGVKCMLVHGDKYGVKTSLYNLYLRAKELSVDTVFYGHTHIAAEEIVDGIRFINPGSMTIYGEWSYCYAVIHNGKVVCKNVILQRSAHEDN